MQKHTLNLFEGDFEKLQREYPDIGAAAIIRRLIRKHLEDRESTTDISRIKAKVSL